MREPVPIDHVLATLNSVKISESDPEIKSSAVKYLKRLWENSKQGQGQVEWQSFLTFWPPRLLDACRKDRLICFFGAGLSIPSGLPSWGEMLRDYFGLEKAFLADDELQTDPLTQAEVASHRIGAEKVQTLMREKVGTERSSATGHLFAAALRLPVYITTNYDALFEQAWKILNPSIPLNVVTNDAWLTKFKIDETSFPSKQNAYLFKIHGCIEQEKEHLILTRSDYRRHYRLNRRFFDIVTYLLSSFGVLFLGFGHKDPEVTRLVEDAIWNFERNESSDRLDGASPRESPHFFSLQFNMRSHTPEIFAARGIVALDPPLADPKTQDLRSSCLTRALIDLLIASRTNFSDRFSLDSDLEDFRETVVSDLQRGLDTLHDMRDDARKVITTRCSYEWINNLLEQLGPLAGQGVYLVNNEGTVVASALPDGVPVEARNPRIGIFRTRPYFQQAVTYRQRFVSDAFESIFNKNLTFTLCEPILDKRGMFAGLLFAACQPGAWNLPLEAARKLWNRDISVLLVDANGVALIPPRNEFEPASVLRPKYRNKVSNNGFLFSKMLALSRRDKLISRAMENIVPLRQDDDVFSLSTDLKQYTVFTDVSKVARSKVGLSVPIFLNPNA
jgi:SIR2-like domain